MAGSVKNRPNIDAGDRRDPLPNREKAKVAVVMAIADRTAPRWGVQFHPESILCPEGDRLVANYVARTAQRASV